MIATRATASRCAVRTEHDAAQRLVRDARRRPRVRHVGVLAGLGAALLGAVVVRALLGDYVITLPDAVRILSGTRIPGASFILTESKLPRAVLATLVGVAFGASGATFQRVLRNPLATPDLVGISAGASAAAVVGIVVLHVSGGALSVAAVVGAVASAAAIRVVAGKDTGPRLILVGVTGAAALLSVVQYLFTRADEYDAQLALQWLTGSLNAADWATVQVLGAALMALLPLLALTSRGQRTAELGPDVAAALGSSRASAEVALLLAVLLAGLGVAAAGPVAFVAFASGPIASSLNAGRSTLAGSALVGACAMVASDYLAAYAVPGTHLPVGVVTGALGAPLLLWLLATGRPGRSHR